MFLESGGTLRLENLPLHTTVEIVRLTGNLNVSNSSSAKILGHFVQGDHVTVRGTTPKDGFLGFLSLNGCPQTQPLLQVLDNQDVVAADLYFEQARAAALRIAGGAGGPAGRVTADFARADAFVDKVPDKTEVEVADYRGRLSLFDGCWTRKIPRADTPTAGSWRSRYASLLADGLGTDQHPAAVENDHGASYRVRHASRQHV